MRGHGKGDFLSYLYLHPNVILLDHILNLSLDTKKWNKKKHASEKKKLHPVIPRYNKEITTTIFVVLFQCCHCQNYFYIQLYLAHTHVHTKGNEILGLEPSLSKPKIYTKWKKEHENI